MPPVRTCLMCLLVLAGAPALAATPRVGQPAPAFEVAPLAGGTPIRLADYQGKVVYLDFWASWCGPCRLSLPWMEQLSRDLADRGLVVIAVNVDEQPAAALTFLERFPASYAVGGDARGAVAALYDVPDMPASFLIDRHGVVRRVHRGFNPQVAKSARDAVVALLAERP